MSDQPLIRWEPMKYQPRNWQADVAGGRMIVVRSRPGARTFDGKFNGRYIGNWDTDQMAMSQMAKLFRDGKL